MSVSSSSARPLACLKQALRQCRAERQQRRGYAEVATEASTPARYSSLQSQPSYRLPTKGFRPGLAIKQNRPDTSSKKIPFIPAPPSIKKTCSDPIKKFTDDQIKVLDPTGARTRLFSLENPDRVKPGDILLVRLKSGEPFSGVCLNIRQINSPIDWAILLRNNLTRIVVEMWFKIYSPNIEGIEIVQRKAKRARRAKLTYMRQPKHDIGSVEGIVRQYMRTKAGQTGVGKGRDANSNKSKRK